MIFYSRFGTISAGLRIGPPKTEDEKALLGTVPGRWEAYTPPPTLKPGIRGRPLAPTTTLIEKRRADCWKTLQSIFQSLYPLSAWGFSTDIGHMGNTKFAFRIPEGVAIAFSETLPAIEKWHAQLQRQAAEAARPPPNKLSGF